MSSLLSAIFEPGFFGSGPVRDALVTGAVVALVSGAVGVFTVLRSQSFAGHALSDLGTLGGSGAYLTGTSPLLGIAGVGMVVAGLMDLFGAERKRSRDVSTGIVLGGVLGLSALFLYLDATRTSTTGAAVTILFGSLFTVTGDTLPATVVLGVLGLATLGLLYRPLLLSSVDNDLAAARGVHVRLLGLTFLATMGIAVSLSALTVGTILSPALLIGPAATALRLTRRPATAMALAAALGLVATWLGVLLAYDSYHWPPAGSDGWPVSFFIMALIFLGYLASGPTARLRERRSVGTGTVSAATVAEA
ncbi:metal ABC transporter permease [Actinospica robiniae]|uniref:metal ABC transporter permease n=1 Tax=Actinospica robiniae TaxID=304901 RepID=UPI0003FB116E|nr:metal ABC transporter permease [Actinospica robiniae]